DTDIAFMFFFSSRRRHTRFSRDWSSDVCSSDLVLADVVRPASTRFMGPPRRGPFWDRWLRVYYADRVLVTVRVERVLSWPSLGRSEERRVGKEWQCSHAAAY